MRAAAVLVPFILLAAGCTDEEAPPTSSSVVPTTNSATPTLAAQAPLPVWELGQQWTYVVDVPGEPSNTFKMIVAEDRASEGLWVVASDDQAQAVHHAIYSTNPVLGRIGKETLSPFQGGGPVAMYRFPLTDGKAWAATFFGEEMRFRAVYAGDISLQNVNPARGLGTTIDGFRITATGPSGTSVFYDYVDAVEWFTYFEIINAEGERDIRLTLTDIDDDYSGPYFFYRGTDVLDKTETHEAAAGVTLKTLSATVPSDWKDRVGFGLRYEGKQGTPSPSVNVSIKRPDGTEAWSRDLTGVRLDDRVVDLTGAANQQAGDWKIDLRMAGSLGLHIRVAGMKNFAEGTM